MLASDNAMTRFTAATLLTALISAMALSPMAAADLLSYVKTDDKAYRWEWTAHTDRVDGTTIHELTLISQVWHGITWHHRLRIITPTGIQGMPPLALLIVSGSGNGEQELREGGLMARELGAPVAILHDIPNQPLFGKLMEDDLLAYTFAKYIETHDTTWPLLLPMVKGAVKAMDAIQEFMQRTLHADVTGFVVSGASKRGWTTWLTPVVDGRVKAIAPQVYDNLNLAKQLQHQRETWGQLSGQISEYTERGLPQRLLAGEKEAVELAAMVDPFAYRQRITIPKLIILGTNDPYWPLDALNVYYPDLTGETYVLYLPNAGHDLSHGRKRAIAGLMALFQRTAGRLKLPTLRWETKEEGSTINLTLTSDLPPRAVRAWIATAPTRDFRRATWKAFAMTPEDQRYIYSRPKPAGGFVAMFSEAVYGEDQRAVSLSTTVRIFP
jgi:PhoPQ-activated pathogenicity-related protein